MNRIAFRKDRYVSPAVRRLVREKTDGKCWYCGEDASKEATTYTKKPNIDHVQPVSKGGTSDISNLVWACWRCNAAKRDKTLQEYREAVGESFSHRFWWPEFTVDDIPGLIDMPIAQQFLSTIREISAYCNRANFCFYGELLGMEPPLEFQI